ncbi:sodium:solute symporter family transporter [Rhodopirellula halodulae]|uniref:sodium:solute symporter family transporter n=1 Tax=Rhodopirellula halodulae TaxID=2894198 RepID=UPI001E4A044C|nr:sodium/solute symporter [Rhodopirellula sp. JC737]MCC9658638.1 sodium/solute symporter [Rhodopirellula sp. JC737]
MTRWPERRLLCLAVACWLASMFGPASIGADDAIKRASDVQMTWEPMPPLPNPLGVAGPFVGVDSDHLIIAGGANFPTPVWENQKRWHDRIHVLKRDGEQFDWLDAGTLPRSLAYGAAVSIPSDGQRTGGVLCLGGSDGRSVSDQVFLMHWNPERQIVEFTDFPPLPTPCVHMTANLLGDSVYIFGGQSNLELSSATNRFWKLDLSLAADPASLQWEALPDCPGSARAFHVAASQHNGFEPCLYVISGRSEANAKTKFLRDTWEYCPSEAKWRQRADAPACVMAGSVIGYGQSHCLVLGGDDGSLFGRADELHDNHPGFPKRNFAYHTITDRWVELPAPPLNQVTTQVVRWQDELWLPSGEIRPRVRTPAIYRIHLSEPHAAFGGWNTGVLVGYLVAVLGIGVYFSRKNKNTNDYFRGGSQIPWWAAGCSIFATMLSSVTFTGIPSKAYAQDWTYAIGNFTIPLVAVVAVFVAIPFFRRIDATSAYEYLEKRFSRPVRWFGSLSFSLFHLFRMAVVMSLTGLALAVATPMTPTQSVLLMGVLSIAYCTIGGIEAVIWTDTLQTVILLGGALVALTLMLIETDGGITGSYQHALNADKLRWANWHLRPDDAQIAFWVIVVGAIGQNLSSYTADQAVVQRYMTTPTRELAARSIWTNAILVIPATLLFFGIGTALHGYYHSHPERISPSITTDQIFPLFIAKEMPVGLAGLIVAGVFAAAQSTVSTSMNSTATALVTDFVRPLHWCQSERGLLRAAKVLTMVIGMAGTSLALFFVDPDIRSLFDTFLVVLGLFMGVLGGLFVLGGVTERANSIGAMTGAVCGAVIMYTLWATGIVHGFLYTTCGIVSCVAIGYLVSVWTGRPDCDLDGLTIHTITAKPKHQSS